MPRLRPANFDHLGHGDASIQVAADDLVLGCPSHDDPFQRHVGAATARSAWRHLQNSVAPDAKAPALHDRSRSRAPGRRGRSRSGGNCNATIMMAAYRQLDWPNWVVVE